MIPKRLRLQIVLYRPEQAALNDLFACLRRLKIPEGYEVAVATGDCSEDPHQMDKESAHWLAGLKWEHRTFGENLGFGVGHNRLWQGSDADYLLVMNPDAYYPADLLQRFAGAAEEKRDFGILEARQIPLEHPKKFDHASGETNWCSGCCAFIRGEAFTKVEGFDPAFFLYGEDVDLSWRIAGLGYKLYYRPEIWVYHRKHLGLEGMEPGSAEKMYSALAQLLLLKKYGQENHLRELKKTLAVSGEKAHQEALHRFEESVLKLNAAGDRARGTARFGRDGRPGERGWEYVPASFCRPDRKLLQGDPQCS